MKQVPPHGCAPHCAVGVGVGVVGVVTTSAVAAEENASAPAIAKEDSLQSVGTGR